MGRGAGGRGGVGPKCKCCSDPSEGQGELGLCCLFWHVVLWSSWNGHTPGVVTVTWPGKSLCAWHCMHA